jgi:hypothetical protein
MLTTTLTQVLRDAAAARSAGLYPVSSGSSDKFVSRPCNSSTTRMNAHFPA